MAVFQVPEVWCDRKGCDSKLKLDEPATPRQARAEATLDDWGTIKLRQHQKDFCPSCLEDIFSDGLGEPDADDG